MIGLGAPLVLSLQLIQYFLEKRVVLVTYELYLFELGKLLDADNAPLHITEISFEVSHAVAWILAQIGKRWAFLRSLSGC